MNDASATRLAQIEATAETGAAAAALDGLKVDRIAQIIAQAQTQAANEGLTGVAAQQRTAQIVAQALTSSATVDLGLTARQRESIVRALAQTGNAEGILNNLARNRTSTITVRTIGGGTSTTFIAGGVARRHSGGHVDKDTPYIVGRHDAEELFVPSTPGRIVSSSETRRALNAASSAPAVSGGGLTVNVNAPVYGVDHLKRTIAEAFREQEQVAAAGSRFS